MTHQEAFNGVWEHFIVKRSLPGLSTLGYAYENQETGARCAIGCLLPDSLHELLRSTSNNSNHILTVMDRMPEVVAFFAGCERKFLEQLQVEHDTVARSTDFHSQFESRLRTFANYWGLTIPEGT